MATPRIAYRPTDQDRRTVTLMVAGGIPQIEIAACLDITPVTLRKKFRREIDTATAQANAKVVQSLFHLATVDRNASACIFWLKARANWREQLPDLTDANGTLGYVLIPAKRASTPMIEHEPDPTPVDPSVVRLPKQV